MAQELHAGFASVTSRENNKTKPNQIARHALIELCKRKNINKDLISVFQTKYITGGFIFNAILCHFYVGFMVY